MSKSRYPQPKKWFPKNPHKYVGDPNNIVARSSWELRFFNWCDMNTSVIAYASEEITIPYLCETDNRMHRYFVDVVMKIRDVNGNVKTYYVEIKPYAQTQPPKQRSRKSQAFINETLTFVKNQSKWKAAKEFARQRGAEFVVITEHELGIGKR